MRGCCRGLSPLLHRALHAGARPIPLFVVALAVALPLVLASLRGRIGKGISKDFGPLPLMRWAFAGLLCAGSFLLFLSALAAVGAGAALTLRNTSVVFAQGLAFLLGERPRRAQMMGAALVTAGASLLGGF